MPLSVSLQPPQELALPEVEFFEVELVKDTQGLGITIAGYVGERTSGAHIAHTHTHLEPHSHCVLPTIHHSLSFSDVFLVILDPGFLWRENTRNRKEKLVFFIIYVGTHTELFGYIYYNIEMFM